MGNDEQWKRRFKEPYTLWSEPAFLRRDVAVSLRNEGGREELYLWNRATGTRTLVSPRPAPAPWSNLLWSALSPTASWRYWIRPEGNLGVLCRSSSIDGRVEELDPGEPPNTILGFTSAGDGTRVAWIGAGASGTAIRCIELAGDESVLRRGSLALPSAEPVDLRLSRDGTILFALAAAEKGGGQVIFALDVRDGAVAARVDSSGDSEFSLGPVSPVAGEPLLAFVESGSRRAMAWLWNPREDSRRALPLEGLPGGFGIADWSPDGKLLLVERFEKAVQSLDILDLASGERRSLGSTGRSYSHWFADPSTVLAHPSDPEHPFRPVLFDASTGVPLNGDEARGGGASRPWRNLTIASVGGVEVQAWLCLPPGKGPFPAIIDIHGGPELAKAAIYNPECLAWVDRGFAWVGLNYRGSASFGRDFARAIIGRLGELELEDLAGTRERLIANGVARPDRVFLTGWSYGGYLALLALGRQPRLWAGAMAGCAMVDLASLMDPTVPDHVRVELRRLMGGKDPAADPEAYEKGSPIRYLPDLVAPALVIQGSEDANIPRESMDRYARMAKELAKPVEVRWYPEGHVTHFEDLDLGAAHLGEMMEFALGVLARLDR